MINEVVTELDAADEATGDVAVIRESVEQFEMAEMMDQADASERASHVDGIRTGYFLND